MSRDLICGSSYRTFQDRSTGETIKQARISYAVQVPNDTNRIGLEIANVTAKPALVLSLKHVPGVYTIRFTVESDRRTGRALETPAKATFVRALDLASRLEPYADGEHEAVYIIGAYRYNAYQARQDNRIRQARTVFLALTSTWDEEEDSEALTTRGLTVARYPAPYEFYDQAISVPGLYTIETRRRRDGTSGQLVQELESLECQAEANWILDAMNAEPPALAAVR